MRKIVAVLLFFPALAFGQATLLGNGLVVKGMAGAQSILRASSGGDAIAEFQNLTFGQKALIAIYNEDPNMESAITFGTRFNNGKAYSTGAYFTGLVNGWNGWGYRGFQSMHATGHLRDSQIITGWSNNAVRLAAGTVDVPTWNDPPPDDSVELGYGAQQNGGVVLLMHPIPAAPKPLPNTLQIYMGSDNELYVRLPNGVQKKVVLQ